MSPGEYEVHFNNEQERINKERQQVESLCKTVADMVDDTRKLIVDAVKGKEKAIEPGEL